MESSKDLVIIGVFFRRCLEFFPIRQGEAQRCTLSPTLFLNYIIWFIM